MKQANWVEIEEKLVAACAQAEADGVEIVPGTFGVYRRGFCCCPITAFLGNEPINAGDAVGAAANRFGLAQTEIWDFVFGFDKHETYTQINSEGYQAGLRVRAKVL